MTVPTSGSYRVLITASSALPASDRGSAFPVQRISVKELWLTVDEEGGRITTDFRPDLVPAGFRKQPGPRTPLRERTNGVGGSTAQNASVSRSSMYGLISGQALYFNPEPHIQAFVPIRSAPFVVRIFDNYSYTYVYESRSATDINGNFYVGCNVTSDMERIDIEIEYVDGQFNFGGAGSGVLASFGSYDCMNQVTTTTLHGPGPQSHVWSQLQKSADASAALFGVRRGSVDVELSSSASISSYTKDVFAGLPSVDRIRIATSNAVWGEYGAFTQAHEFGHAAHHRVLGGYQSGTCGGSHNFGTVESYACAYAEGFADYHAAVTLPSEAPSYVAGIEARNFTYSPFQTGVAGRQEIQIAALLYDVTDPANEPHDVVQLPCN